MTEGLDDVLEDVRKGTTTKKKPKAKKKPKIKAKKIKIDADKFKKGTAIAKREILYRLGRNLKKKGIL